MNDVSTPAYSGKYVRRFTEALLLYSPKFKLCSRSLNEYSNWFHRREKKRNFLVAGGDGRSLYMIK